MAENTNEREITPEMHKVVKWAELLYNEYRGVIKKQSDKVLPTWKALTLQDKYVSELTAWCTVAAAVLSIENKLLTELEDKINIAYGISRAK